MTTVQANQQNNKWFWLALGATLLFCLCAVGLAVFVATRVGQKVQEGVKTDPEAAVQAAHTIADYELPPGYQEQMAMDIFAYTMVMIGPERTGPSGIKPFIMLAQFQFGVSQEQMEEQMRQAAGQQAGRRGLAMEVVETKEMTIRGTETEVIIYEGTDQSGGVMRQLITTFPGKGGTAMLMIMGDAQNWDQEEIDTFIESIK